MIIVPKIFKKVAMTTVLSAFLVGSFVTPSFAAIDASSLDNKTGNELVSNFYVTVVDAEDTVVISWDETALNLNVKDFDLKTDVQKSIDYYVSPGESNDDDLTVSILLKVPQASADALNTLEDSDDEVIESSFTDAGYVYYVLKEGLTLEPSAAAQFNTFDIAFKTVIETGTPFTASLIAIKEVAEAVKTPPTLEGVIVGFPSSIDVWVGSVGTNTGNPEWSNAITKISYSFDGGTTYEEVNEADVTFDGGNKYKFVGAANLDFLQGKNNIIYKFEAEGYEDATISIGTGL